MKRRRVKFLLVGIGVMAPLVALAIRGPLTRSDLGSQFDYRPLVRHQISQRHCYDSGSYYCETPSRSKPAFMKEFTMGFLFDGIGPRRDYNFNAIYACEEKGRVDKGKYDVLVDNVDGNAKRGCHNQGLRTTQLGYVAFIPDIEAPVALYRCRSLDGSDVLLTNDTNECLTVGYGSGKLLGFIMAGGELAQKR